MCNVEELLNCDNNSIVIFVTDGAVNELLTTLKYRILPPIQLEYYKRNVSLSVCS